MIGQRMFVCGLYGLLYVTNTTYKAVVTESTAGGGIDDGVPEEVLKVWCGSTIAAGCGGYQVLRDRPERRRRYGRIRGVHLRGNDGGCGNGPPFGRKKDLRFHLRPDGARGMRYAQGRIRWNRDGHGRCQRFRDGEARNLYVPTDRPEPYYIENGRQDRVAAGYGIQGKLQESSQGIWRRHEGIQGGCEICDGFECNLHDVGRNTREMGGFVKDRNDAGAGAPPRRDNAAECWSVQEKNWVQWGGDMLRYRGRRGRFPD